MENPIKYNDLFDADVLKGVESLKGTLAEMQTTLKGLVEEAKKGAEGLKPLLNPPKGGGGHNAPAKTIEDMYEEYKKLKTALNEVTEELFKVDEKGKSVVFTQKEINKVVKLGEEINREGAETYNNLSKRYSMLKILINNLTESERENTEEGKKMVENARQIYEQMNRMQQSTGKYQLQVGNYSKALNGLNIATQQVIRELPVMANGMQMFVMAISNNIPILLDNIKMFKEEQAALAKQGVATTSVMSAMLKTIFSWQTALVVVLSVLPMVIRKIKEKKDALHGANDETERAWRENYSYAKSLENVNRSLIDKTNKVRVLTDILNDENRSMQDRIDAGTALKQTFDEELKGYSAQEIAMGKAKTAIDKITQAIIDQAEATGYMNEISRLASEQFTQMMGFQKIAETDKTAPMMFGGKVGVSAVYRYYKSRNEYEQGIIRKTLSRTEKKRLDEYAEYYEKYIKLGKDIDKIKDKIRPSSLFEDKDKKDKEIVIDKKDELFEYYRDIVRQGLDLMTEGEEKEVELVRFKYETEINDLKKKLATENNLTAKEREAINRIIVGLELNKIKAIQDIHDKFDAEEEKRKEKELKGIDKEVDTYYKDTKKWVDTLLKGMQFGIKPPEPERKKGILLSLLMGEDAQEKDLRVYLRNIEKAFNLAFQYMNEMIEKRRELAQAAVDAAQKEEDSAKHAMEVEQEARANGYAHNVEFARREWEEKKRLKEEAMREEQRLAKIQQKIDEAQQMSSLLVATANIWAQYTKMSALGVALAGVATTAMWGSFAAAKIQAADLVKTKEYGEGMSEYLNYGGSHASGNDIDFGTMKDGTRRRVERGEMVAVINKRNVGKYGVDGISDIVASLNSGTFEDRYGLAFAGLTATPGGVDLSKVEEGINTLVNQGERKVYQQGGKTIEIYKNRKRIINN